MSEPAVLYEKQGDVGLITLNRPDERNTMSSGLLGDFAARVAQARHERAMRCLVVTGSGGSFCAGANLKHPVQSQSESLLPHERSFAMYEPFLSLLDVDVPVLGALNGHAIGGGFGLALLCDVRVARGDAKYGATFTALGLHPGMSVTYLLPRLVGLSRASEWLFTGRLFDGHQGAASGLFSAALAAEEVLPYTLEMARAIAANGPIAVRMTKRSMMRGLGWEPKAAAYDEAFSQAMTVETSDAKEGIAAALERRKPKFQGL